MAAYMTGHKSVVNALGVYGSRAESNFDHPKVETMGEAIRRHSDKALGIVTNTEVQDATPAALAELHDARRLREDRVVLADPDAVAGLEAGAALAHDDLAAGDDLAGEDLHAEALGVRVTTVAGAGCTLLVRHVFRSPTSRCR